VPTMGRYGSCCRLQRRGHIPTKDDDDKFMTEFVVKDDWAYSQLRASDRTVILDSMQKKTKTYGHNIKSRAHLFYQLTRQVA
jgi:hypothetical protein